MSKLKARPQGKRNSLQHSRRRPWKAGVVIILVMSVAGIILAKWRSAHPFVTRLAQNPPASQTPSPSREYIYAGGKLVAIEEPANSGGGGPAPTSLLATATSGTTVFLSWTAPTGPIGAYQVERSQSINGPYATLSPNVTTTSFNDTTVASGVAYLYRVRAVYTSGSYSAYSNKDLATTIIYTEDPLSAGVTPIRAVHLTELRKAVNAVRALAGLSTASWTYPDPVSTPLEQRRRIYLEDATDLRAQLDEALIPLERLQPYAPDPPLARGNPIRAAHFTELRERMK